MYSFYNIVEREMRAVNDIIISSITSKQDLIEVVSKYLVNSGGKRIRPVLTILCSKLCGYSGNSHIELAASVEFTHAATLLHDDVVDNSAMRRFQPSANIIWGNQTSILVGDFLFAKSFEMMVKSGSIKALSRLSKASSVIAEGEINQLVSMNEKRMITTDEYYDIIKSKTAELFSAACEIGAIIAGMDEKICDILNRIGMIMGVIFQISDDALDYFSNQKEIGKNIGDDFAEGKITIPIILAYENSSKEEKAFLEHSLFAEEKSKDHFKTAISLLEKYNVKSDIKKIQKKHIRDLDLLIESLNGEQIYKNALKEIVSSIANI